MADIEGFLKIRAKEGLLRTLRPVSRRRDGIISINPERADTSTSLSVRPEHSRGTKRVEWVDFSSNDYLGLSGHPKLIEEAKKAIDKFGTSSSASRLMSGDLELHHLLEEKIARFKNKEAALFFNSGYQANAGIISSLYGRRDCIFLDRLSHASIIDGVILSQAKHFRFNHNDTEHLETILERERRRFKSALIITESIFSMDGDKAPLKELVRLKEKYNCRIFVDEAHATGIFGKTGAGIVEEEGLEDKIDFIMGTFSKALGGFGAYLAASKEIIEYLINTCRSFIYSTALPAAIVASNLASLDVVREEPYRRRKILELAQYFRNTLKKKDFEVRGESQIIPLIVGDNLRIKELADRLQEKGYWVLPIRPPTVPKNESRLRFTLTYHHQKEMLTKLIDDISIVRI